MPPKKVPRLPGRVNNVMNVKAVGDCTTFIWEVGRFQKDSFGDFISTTKLVQAGKDEWKLTLFPKGVVDIDWASLYVTNVKCSMEDEDSNYSALANVRVTVVPEPPGKKKKKDEKKKAGSGVKAAKGGANATDDSASSAKGSMKASTIASSTTRQSTKSGGSQAGSRKGEDDKGGQKPASSGAQDEVVKTLSTQYGAGDSSSWGWEQFLELEKMYNYKLGYLTEVDDPLLIQDGILTMQVEILAVTGIQLEAPERDTEITEKGQQRTRWQINDISTIISKVKPNQKISSSEFNSDGWWYFDLYPRGYVPREQEELMDEDAKFNYMSLFLHSARKHTTSEGKQSFQLGIKIANAPKGENETQKGENEKKFKFTGADQTIYFPGQVITATFKRKQNSHGMQKFLLFNEEGSKSEPKVSDPELIAGQFNKGGVITLVLDMAVTDNEEGSVKHMLQRYPYFDKKKASAALSWLPFGKAKTSESRCAWCGEIYKSEDLNLLQPNLAGKEHSLGSRMPEFGFEIGREFVMDVLVREGEHAVYKYMSQIAQVDQKVPMAMAWMGSKIADLMPGQPGTGGKDEEEKNAEEGDMEYWNLDQLAPGTRKYKQKVQENKKQLDFVKRLRGLQEAMEFAHFAKPVCDQCKEAVKEYDNDRMNNTLAASQEKAIFGVPKKTKKDKDNDVPAWEEFYAEFEQQYEKMKLGMHYRGVQTEEVSLVRSYQVTDKEDPEKAAERDPRHAMTLCRGLRYYEPFEATRQCNGRVHSNDPDNVDDERDPDSFCDVRFDRVQGKSKQAPSKHHCCWTGKVFCAKCVRFQQAIPEHEDNPEAADLKPVCHMANEFRASTTHGKIQPVSEKRVEEVGKQQIRVSGIADEEEVDAEEPWYGAYLRKLPGCGENIADMIWDDS